MKNREEKRKNSEWGLRDLKSNVKKLNFGVPKGEQEDWYRKISKERIAKNFLNFIKKIFTESRNSENLQQDKFKEIKPRHII